MALMCWVSLVYKSLNRDGFVICVCDCPPVGNTMVTEALSKRQGLRAWPGGLVPLCQRLLCCGLLPWWTVNWNAMSQNKICWQFSFTSYYCMKCGMVFIILTYCFVVHCTAWNVKADQSWKTFMVTIDIKRLISSSWRIKWPTQRTSWKRGANEYGRSAL